MEIIQFKEKQTVRHKMKKLHEARFHSWSKSGKRVGIIHNASYPFGVSWVVDWFDPKNIEII